MRDPRWPRELWSLPIGILLAVYIVVVVVTIVVGGIIVESIGHGDLDVGFLWWPLPWLFPLASATLVVNAAQLVGRSRDLLIDRQPAFCIVAAFHTVGAALALSSHHAWDALPVAISGVVLVGFAFLRPLLRTPRP